MESFAPTRRLWEFCVTAGDPFASTFWLVPSTFGKVFDKASATPANRIEYNDYYKLVHFNSKQISFKCFLTILDKSSNRAAQKTNQTVISWFSIRKTERILKILTIFDRLRCAPARWIERTTRSLKKRIQLVSKFWICLNQSIILLKNFYTVYLTLFITWGACIGWPPTCSSGNPWIGIPCDRNS